MSVIAFTAAVAPWSVSTLGTKSELNPVPQQPNAAAAEHIVHHASRRPAARCNPFGAINTAVSFMVSGTDMLLCHLPLRNSGQAVGKP